MSITKDPGRQFPLVAVVRFTYADLESGVDLGAVDLPGGAIRMGGELVIETAFNSATSDTISVGDAGGNDAALAATDVTSAGTTALTGFSGEIQSTPETLTLTWTGTGAAPTAGSGYLRVTYGIEGRATDAQP